MPQMSDLTLIGKDPATVATEAQAQRGNGVSDRNAAFARLAVIQLDLGDRRTLPLDTYAKLPELYIASSCSDLGVEIATAILRRSVAMTRLIVDVRTSTPELALMLGLVPPNIRRLDLRVANRVGHNLGAALAVRSMDGLQYIDINCLDLALGTLRRAVAERRDALRLLTMRRSMPTAMHRLESAVRSRQCLVALQHVENLETITSGSSPPVGQSHLEACGVLCPHTI